MAIPFELSNGEYLKLNEPLVWLNALPSLGAYITSTVVDTL